MPVQTTDELYKEGDEVFIRGIIRDLEYDGGVVKQYLVTLNLGTDADGDKAEESVYAYEDAFQVADDKPLVAGSWIKTRQTLPGRTPMIGRVVALRKGKLWIDWAPFDEEAEAFATATSKAVIAASDEEVKEAREAFESA